jgi:hypothetical protein
MSPFAPQDDIFWMLTLHSICAMALGDTARRKIHAFRCVIETWHRQLSRATVGYMAAKGHYPSPDAGSASPFPAPSTLAR